MQDPEAFAELAVADVHLSIRGRVQGVGFRAEMATVALRLQVVGWVRNRHDGTVEAVLRAEPRACSAILDWARRGPPGARVEAVARRAATAAESLEVGTGFRLRETC